MKFKIDENLPVEVAELLRQAGHEASTVLEQSLGSSSDSDIALVCQRDGRVLITMDTDFADIRSYPPAQFSGIIVLRLKQQDKHHVFEVFSRLIRIFSDEPLERHLWIVEENQIRIRG